jgi:PAS domain S-box-containing protein
MQDTHQPSESIDVYKQKALLEQALAECEERFRIMTEFTQDWEYWISPEMEFVYISSSCETISGYKAEEFRKDPDLLNKIVHLDDREAWQKHEEVFFHSDQPGSLDLCILTRSGEPRWIHHLCQPVYDADGKWMGRQVSNRDITERKLAEKERVQLIDQLNRAYELQKVLSAHLMHSQETERRVIARELHDEVGQVLTVLKINLQTLQRTENCPDMSESIAMIGRTLQQVRAISLNLPPTMLEDLGLAPALRWLLDRQGREAGFGTSFTANQVTRLPQQIEIACYRVGQEALTNIMRHAHAQQVSIELTQTVQVLHLTIQDDGSGFDVEAAYHNGLVGAGMGLISMQERVLLVGGRMEIESTLGQGTKLHASFPLSLPSPGSRRQKKQHV